MSGYSDGRRLEYAARDALEADGYAVIRSAGSKTPVDLVALKLDELLFVQCKASRPIGPGERDQLRALAALVNALPIEARWVKVGRAARTVGFWRVLPDTDGRPVRSRWITDYAVGAET